MPGTGEMMMMEILIVRVTYGLILHGWAGDAPVKLVVIHYAGINQRLNRHLVLEQ